MFSTLLCLSSVAFGYLKPAGIKCNHNNECLSGRCYNPRQGGSWCERAGRSGDYVMTDADRYHLDRSSACPNGYYENYKGDCVYIARSSQLTDADRYHLDRSSDSVIARLVEELEGEAGYNCCEEHPHWSCCRRSVARDIQDDSDDSQGFSADGSTGDDAGDDPLFESLMARGLTTKEERGKPLYEDCVKHSDCESGFCDPSMEMCYVEAWLTYDKDDRGTARYGPQSCPAFDDCMLTCYKKSDRLASAYHECLNQCDFGALCAYDRSTDNLKGARVSNQEKGEWCMVHSDCKSNWCSSTSYKCH